MEEAKVAQLRDFVDNCKSDPSLLHDPSLVFFRDYLESLGAQIPPASKKSHNNQKSDGMPNAEFSDSNNSKNKSADIDDDDDDDNDDEIFESDLELDSEDWEPDNDPPPKMGDPTIEVTEESRHALQKYKAIAVDAISEGRPIEALALLKCCIKINPTSAILYATRASVFVKMLKPDAAIRDADAALQINPDSAKGYKSRGMAKALLGKWEEATSDLHIASKLDHDEEIHTILKMLVEPNAQKIEEHCGRYERLRKKREQKKAGKEHLRAEVGDEELESGNFGSARDGQLGPGGSVLSIHKSSELDAKLDAATILSRLAIIYFTATWCGPCRFMAPAYKTLAEQHPKVVFLKIDIDEVGDAARRWNVSSVPTFFFVKDGKEIDEIVGADKSGLERRISLHAPKI